MIGPKYRASARSFVCPQGHSVPHPSCPEPTRGLVSTRSKGSKITISLAPLAKLLCIIFQNEMFSPWPLFLPVQLRGLN